MSEKVTVTISDSTAAELRNKINRRREEVSRKKEELRHGGTRSGRQAEELSSKSFDTSTDVAIKGAIEFTLDEMD